MPSTNTYSRTITHILLLAALVCGLALSASAQSKELQAAQKAAVCNTYVVPSTLNISAAGGTVNVIVGNPGLCQWLASTTATSWIDVNPLTSSHPAASVTIDITPNLGPSRGSTVSLGGNNGVLVILQAAGPCTYSFNPSVSNKEGNTGSYGFLNVTKSNYQCPMDGVTSTASWLKVLSFTDSNVLTQQVEFTAAANNGVARSGQIKIGTSTFTMNQGNGCFASISPSTAQVPASGGSGSVNVDPSDPTCTVVQSLSSWIKASALAGEKVNYTVDPNTGPERAGSISIIGRSFQITQADGCNYTFNTSTMNFQPTAGTGSFQVTASSSQCAWSPKSNAPWVKITSAAQMKGSGQVTFTVDYNPGAARSTTIAIGTKVVTINQFANNCTYTLNNSKFDFQPDAATGSIQVTASNSYCMWSPLSSAGWVKITSAAQVTGNGTVAFTIDSNPGPTRIATITIGNKVATISQLALSCTFAINPGNAQFGPAGGEVDVNVTTSFPACTWSAGPASAFISLVSGITGAGNGVTKLKVQPNNGPSSRSGSVLIAGKTFSVVQAGTTPQAITLISLSPGFAPKGGNQFVFTVTGSNFTNDCRIHWKGSERATTYINNTSLSAFISSIDIGSEGMVPVSVVNIASGAESNVKPFAVYGTLANVSAASFDGGRLAPDSIVAAFGDQLAKGTKAADSLPLPTELEGSTVTITDSIGNEHQAQLLFASYSQINYLMPAKVAPGKAAIDLQSDGGPTRIGTVEIEPVGPGLFSANSTGEGPASALVLRVKMNGDQVYEETVEYHPEKGDMPKPIELDVEGEEVYLVVFGTGIRNRSSVDAVTVELGDVGLGALYAGEAPGYSGLDQINVALTNTLVGAGELSVRLIVDGIKSNTVKVTFK